MLGYPRPYGVLGDCCLPAPSVMEFDSNGKLLQAWGGRAAGEFHWLHQVSVDSRGNVYTAEVDTGKRIQKFIRYGDDGCSGTGRTTVGGVLP
ncbi:MAG: hypothetical protein EHM55_10735 [Acidobacteria bacterium]|nr:MAG: hypothetical protein EHM55_10735 [Acidobacteriota bacterium]